MSKKAQLLGAVQEVLDWLDKCQRESPTIHRPPSKREELTAMLRAAIARTQEG